MPKEQLKLVKQFLSVQDTKNKLIDTKQLKYNRYNIRTLTTGVGVLFFNIFYVYTQ